MLKTILEQYRNGERGMPTYDELAAIAGGDHDGHARINGGACRAQAEPGADERAAFEDWMRANRYDVGTFASGEYHNMFARNAWMGWQARAAQSSQRAAIAGGDALGWFVHNGTTHTLEAAALAGKTPAAKAYAAASSALARLHEICLRHGCGDEVMHDWLERVLAGQRAGVAECQWTHDFCEESGLWDSACGEAWGFIDGGPQENGVKFCHGCGGRIVIAAAPTPAAQEGGK